MARIILRNRDGWTAQFQDVDGMPNEEMPLPFTSRADVQTVEADMRSRFPGAQVVHRWTRSLS
jgi:hypothetical protein